MMPGPVSQSYQPYPDLRTEWLQELQSEGTKFFVLKCVDFLRWISEEQAEDFNDMLKAVEKERERIGKEVKAIIEREEGRQR
jgi:hypothetical protein